MFDLTHDLYLTSDLTFSPGGPWLAAVANNSWSPGRVIIWDITTREHRVLYESNLPLTTNLTFSPDAQWLVGGSGIYVWRTNTWVDPVRLEVPGGNHQVAVSLDGHWLVGATLERTISIWEVETWKRVSTIVQEDVIRDIAVSPDGKWLVTGLGQGVDDPVNEAQLWAMPHGELMARMPHPLYVSNVAFSPDGRWIASGSREVQIWEFSP